MTLCILVVELVLKGEIEETVRGRGVIETELAMANHEILSLKQLVEELQQQQVIVQFQTGAAANYKESSSVC